MQRTLEGRGHASSVLMNGKDRRWQTGGLGGAQGAGAERDRREQRNGTDLKHWPATDKWQSSEEEEVVGVTLSEEGEG